MNDFNLHTPARILFGKGVIAGLREQIPHDARVLTTHGDGSMKETGVLDQALDALKGMDALGFGSIESNPAYETLMNTVKLVREQKMTLLLAVGGGSVLDGTKFIAAAANYPENIDSWHILQTGGKEIRNAVPIDCVSTLPTTDSESNAGAMISRKTAGDKWMFHSAHVQPVFAVLGPVYIYTLPPRQVANGIADAFVYTVEQYVTKPVDAKVQDCFVKDILLTLIENDLKVLKEPGNYDMRANAMWTATWALDSLTGAGVPQDWATYMLGHELTTMHGLDHAQTLAIVLLVLWNEKRNTKRARLLQYVEHVWNTTEGSDDERIDAATVTTRNSFEQLGMPTHLPDYGLGGSPIPALLKELEEYGITQLDENHDITLDVNRRIYEATYQAFYISNLRFRAFRPGLDSQYLTGVYSGEFI